jgi:glycosyltransferase 2 family protein
MKRGHLLFLLKLSLSVGLLWLVLSRLTWHEVRLALADPRWGWLGAALTAYGLSAWGGAQQWAWILRTAGLATPAGEIRRLYFIGLFFNNFLPANIGGDAYKIIDLGRRENCPGRVFCATLLDRLLGLAALTIVASLAAGACLMAGLSLPRVTWILALVLAFLGGALAVLVSRRLGALLPRLLLLLRLPTLSRRAETVAGEFLIYRRRLPWLGRIFLFSVGVQSLRIAVHLLVAMGLRLDPDLAQTVQLTVLIPLLALSLTLPVTVNGIGLRETVASALLVHTGLAAHGVVAMEMMAFLVMVLFSLTGGVLWWRGRRPGPERS